MSVFSHLPLVIEPADLAARLDAPELILVDLTSAARYAEGQGNEANNAKLLNALKGVPEDQRTARFQCVMVYMRHAKDPTPIICQGTWEGRVITELKGTEGFGYDPLFYVPSEGMTSAELSPERKNQLSHRAQALKKLLAALS